MDPEALGALMEGALAALGAEEVPPLLVLGADVPRGALLQRPATDGIHHRGAALRGAAHRGAALRVTHARPSPPTRSTRWRGTSQDTCQAGSAVDPPAKRRGAHERWMNSSREWAM